MLMLAALTFPNIDPEAFSIGPVSIKWYGLAYMGGLILGWLYVRRLLSTPHLTVFAEMRRQKAYLPQIAHLLAIAPEAETWPLTPP